FTLREGSLMSDELGIGKGNFREGDVDFTDQIRNANGFYNFHDGPLLACMMFEYETKMHVIRRIGGPLSDTVEPAAKDNPRIQLVSPGCFQSYLDLSENGRVQLMGQIVEGPGQPVLGNPRPTRARLCYKQSLREESNSPFHFGIGNPSPAWDAGASGLCP